MTTNHSGVATPGAHDQENPLVVTGIPIVAAAPGKTRRKLRLHPDIGPFFKFKLPDEGEQVRALAQCMGHSLHLVFMGAVLDWINAAESKLGIAGTQATLMTRKHRREMASKFRLLNRAVWRVGYLKARN